MTYTTEQLENLVGRLLLAFRSDLWDRAGGDIGDNSCFWQLAEVQSYTVVLPEDEEETEVHLRFLSDGKMGWYVLNGLKVCPNLLAS